MYIINSLMFTGPKRNKISAKTTTRLTRMLMHLI